MNDAPPMLVFGQALGPPFGFPLWLIFLLIFLAHGGWVIGGCFALAILRRWVFGNRALREVEAENARLNGHIERLRIQKNRWR